jgi:uncharacterized membrane protein
MRVNPFDIKTLLLARHAQHVVLIHFPIALFLVGIAFDFFGRWFKEQQLLTAAYYNLVGAALATVPTLITGVLAWQFALEGQKLKGILLMHLILGWLSSILIWVVAIIHWRTRRKLGAALPGYLPLIEAVAALAIIVTGHLGGFLSGVNGG